MPQLDFGNPLMLSQVVWLTIIFVVFYLLLRNWALPQVAEVLERRAATIAGNLDAARSAKAQADAATAEVKHATADANARAQAEVAEAVARARAAAAAQAIELNAALDRRLAEAESSIAVARTQAMGALRSIASEAAGALVLRLTGHAPDPQRVDAAVGDALAQRG